MEEVNCVVEKVDETPVNIPEVVEAVQAIQPVQPVIVDTEKTFLGWDSRTWTDVAVISSAVGAGVALGRLIPWAFGKVKSAVETTKEAIEMAKQAKQAVQQATTPEQPSQQPTEATPETPQENK